MRLKIVALIVSLVLASAAIASFGASNTGLFYSGTHDRNVEDGYAKWTYMGRISVGNGGVSILGA